MFIIPIQTKDAALFEISCAVTDIHKVLGFLEHNPSVIAYKIISGSSYRI